MYLKIHRKLKQNEQFEKSYILPWFPGFPRSNISLHNILRRRTYIASLSATKQCPHTWVLDEITRASIRPSSKKSGSWCCDVVREIFSTILYMPIFGVTTHELKRPSSRIKSLECSVLPTYRGIMRSLALVYSFNCVHWHFGTLLNGISYCAQVQS